MKIHKITYPDIENGLGFRVTIWVSGCPHACKGCQNPETWDKMSGREFTEEDKEKIFEVLNLKYIKGLTLSGGDPLSFYFDEVYELVKEIKEKFPNKDIWCYTGYKKQDIKGTNKEKIFEYIDVLVDGQYKEKERDTTLEFRGSKNQSVYSISKNEDGEYNFSRIYSLKK